MSEYDDVLTLQEFLVAVATGDPRDNDMYNRLREPVIAKAGLFPYLPAFVKRCRSVGMFWNHVIQDRPHYHQRRQYLWDQFLPVLDHVEGSNHQPSFDTTKELLDRVDHESVQNSWHKAISRIGNDPEGAITAARTLVESICIHIIEAGEVEVDEKWDLPKLYREASTLLNLAPEQHREDILKQILGGCKSVVDGLAALRNKLGDAHGSSSKRVKPSPRHATLAVNLGGALATFLISTFDERGLRRD